MRRPAAGEATGPGANHPEVQTVNGRTDEAALMRAIHELELKVMGALARIESEFRREQAEMNVRIMTIEAKIAREVAELRTEFHKKVDGDKATEFKGYTMSLLALLGSIATAVVSFLATRH